MRTSFQWIEPGGAAVWDLASNGILPLWGFTGLHAAPVRIARRQIAGQPGAVVEAVEDDVRSFAIPVILEAPSEDEFRPFVEAWARRLDPTRGPGQLVCTNPGVSVRAISCYCVDGLRFTESEDLREPGAVETVLEFEAPDPYWYDVLPSVVQWRPGGTGGKWFDPPAKSLLPLSLGPSTVLGTQTIEVASAKPVWPRWTILGPGTTVRVANVTTGRQWVWSGTIGVGEELVVDTAPLAGTVTLEGANAFDGLTAWDLWPLMPGRNELDVTVAGSGTDTRVRAEWRNAYNGP